MKQPLLQKNGTVMIISPSWFRGEERTYALETHLNTMGFEAETHPHCLEKVGQFAGTLEERVLAIHEGFADPNIHAIMCAAGGYGALQLLSHLNYDLIKANPKPFVGYSDVTALLNAIYARTGLVTYHGPMGCFATHKESAKTWQSFLDVVVNGASEINIGGHAVKEGTAKGVLLGGNMTVFDQLIGTPFMPKAENIILFLEDTTDEKINELDKKLLHLKHAGFLAHVRGVILGDMNKLDDNADLPYGKTPAEIVAQYLPNVPLTIGVDCGHEEHLLTFPVGAEVTLSVTKFSSALSF